MPTKRIANKSAALEAIRQLHESGELNRHLLPVSKTLCCSGDSEGEEEEKAALERKIKHAGTARRYSYYPNKVRYITFSLPQALARGKLYY